MLVLISELIRHKHSADEALLNTILEHEQAARDEELRRMLHHMLVSNRFWMLTLRGDAIDRKQEAIVPASLEELIKGFGETRALELDWLSQTADTDLEASITTPYHPGMVFTAGQAVLQVCLHSQGHRSQCLMRLRSLGITPPTLDFILWVKTERTSTESPASPA
jgi:uncharacterized damage-inducible protein DinB